MSQIVIPTLRFVADRRPIQLAASLAPRRARSTRALSMAGNLAFSRARALDGWQPPLPPRARTLNRLGARYKELHGGVGVTEEACIARYMRDVIAAGPGEYPTFALLDIIAQKEGLPVETQVDFVRWVPVGYKGYNGYEG